MADDMMEDATERLKRSVTTRKGRGFGGEDDGEGSSRPTAGDDSMFETSASVEAGRAQKSVEGWTVFVTGVHEEATEDGVTEKFSEYGKIKNVHLNLDRRTGNLKGYAFVEYKTFQEAQNAVTALDNTNYLGQTLHVDFAFVKGSGGNGNTGGKGRRH